MEPELESLLSAPPEPERPYVYRGTACHINKFGILNPDALEKVIRCTTRLRAEMLRERSIVGNLDLEHLRAIHRYLFQDVYEWAGELRTIDFEWSEKPLLAAQFHQKIVGPQHMEPPIAQFSKATEIEADCEHLFNELKAEYYLRGLDREAFALRGTFYFERLLLIHPFRDGNGRSIRTFFRYLAAHAGWCLDLDAAPQTRRHLAAYQAHCGNPSTLVEEFRQAVVGRQEPSDAIVPSATRSGQEPKA